MYTHEGDILSGKGNEEEGSKEKLSATANTSVEQTGNSSSSSSKFVQHHYVMFCTVIKDKGG